MERLAGRIILLWGWRRALAAFLAGALAVLAQAPFDFFAVCFVSFPILVWLLDGATTTPPAGLFKRLTPAFAIGWWFGFGYFSAGLWWVGGAFLVEADSFAWALPFAMFGLPALLACFYGLATALARLVWSDDIGRIAALAFGFALAEWLRGFIFTGFPWNAIGYAAMPVPLLMQSASVVGLAGMNALAVLVFAMPALLAAPRHRRVGLVLALVLVALHAGFGYVRLTPSQEPIERALAVRIVQPATDLSEKWDDSVRDRVFKTMIDLSTQPPADGSPKPQLIVWPETSVPFLFTERPDALTALGEMLTEGQMLLAGAVRGEGGSGASPGARYYNSVVAIDDKGEIADAVDKVHLVPFGEYLPFEDMFERLGILQLVAGPMMFEPGSKRHTIALPSGIGAALFVCYEIIFPDLVAVDAASADLIVNVTNDAWFGDTPGPYQHFRQAQLRAVETGRPVVRAANTGISGLIDRHGRVVDALAMNARGIVDVSVPFFAQQRPRWQRPDLAGPGVGLLFLLVAIGSNVRQRLRAN